MLLFLDPGSEIRDPEWVKIRIRDKHPGSTTLSLFIIIIFQSIRDAGADVIVSGGKIGDMALHYINKYNMMAVRLTSKWDIRRLAKTTGATALPRVTAPTAEEFGLADQELSFYWNLFIRTAVFLPAVLWIGSGLLKPIRKFVLRYRQCCGSGFNGVPGSGSGFRRAKMTHNLSKKIINFIF